ncbi:co-chaperone GrpE protein, putative [Theileria equi strain WA]|uniref:GrpE protein homolog n=1 Tax=Theileria equi strain WA TaxID=1537102 RepID=L1LFF8_THEEQ|nr:co-chaperone GrpE protein, putative [Theileria equi strain WA]EKX74091.1 co-chaperone GrpE protein, putative [Theileria equi strain WA]|eukprot:XP_004833543.1 co-chaperone GrpE protein, putative [Theileria equi strain WA]
MRFNAVSRFGCSALRNACRPFVSGGRFHTKNALNGYNSGSSVLYRPFLLNDFRLMSTKQEKTDETEEKVNQEVEEEEETQEEVPEKSELEVLHEENVELKEKLTTLEKKLKELELKYKMSLENCDHLCTVYKKEVENTKVYAITEFAKNLLEVADTFELAFKSIQLGPDAEATDTLDPKHAEFVNGIKMTETILHNVFEKFGVKRYESLKETFNPQVHEAMFEVQDGSSSNTVVQVVQNGYTINNRILRPAKVGVSKRT